MAGSCTFAAVGHNEADRLHYALGQMFEAAAPGDEVWFVDSASTDDSAERAAALGADVVAAPLGKGGALATALARCRTPFICFVDADTEWCSSNIPAVLRDTIVHTGADMVIGGFTERARRFSVVPGIYVPLRDALFPDVPEVVPERPLSGQRALRVDLDFGRIPPAFGVEAHLNLQLHLAGCEIVDAPLGEYRGPLRGYANLVALGSGVASEILDLAETKGRLCAGERPAWQAWVDNVLEVISAQPGTPAEEPAYLERLRAAAARPLPERERALVRDGRSLRKIPATTYSPRKSASKYHRRGRA